MRPKMWHHIALAIGIACMGTPILYTAVDHLFTPDGVRTVNLTVRPEGK